jgi:hypothetical protein
VPVAAALADRAVRLRGGDRLSHFFHLVRGMAAYRMGKDVEALEWLRKSQQGNNPYSAMTALVFEALAQQQLGRRDEARAALKRADGMYRQLLETLAGSEAGPLGREWVDVLIFQIARDEAQQVIEKARSR